MRKRRMKGHVGKEEGKVERDQKEERILRRGCRNKGERERKEGIA